MIQVLTDGLQPGSFLLLVEIPLLLHVATSDGDSVECAHFDEKSKRIVGLLSRPRTAAVVSSFPCPLLLLASLLLLVRHLLLVAMHLLLVAKTVV